MDLSPHELVARDLGGALVKTAPPILGWAAASSGWLPALLNDALVMASLLYVALQGAYLLAKWRREHAQRRQDKAAIEALMHGRVAQPGDKAP